MGCVIVRYWYFTADCDRAPRSKILNVIDLTSIRINHSHNFVMVVPDRSIRICADRGGTFCDIHAFVYLLGLCITHLSINRSWRL